MFPDTLCIGAVYRQEKFGNLRCLQFNIKLTNSQRLDFFNSFINGLHPLIIEHGGGDSFLYNVQDMFKRFLGVCLFQNGA